MNNNGPDRLPRRDELPRPPAERAGARIMSSIRARRVVAEIIDLQLANLVYMLVMWLLMPLFGMEDIREYMVYNGYGPHPATAAVFLVLMLFKDIARSPGKRIMKLELTGGEGSVPVWKRMLRNITVVVWPVEVIALLVSGRRLADRILGLDVVAAEEKTEAAEPDQG